MADFELLPPLRSRRLGRIVTPGAANAGPRRGLTLSAVSAAGESVRMGEINTPDRGLQFKAVWFDLDDTLWSDHFLYLTWVDRAFSSLQDGFAARISNRRVHAQGVRLGDPQGDAGAVRLRRGKLPQHQNRPGNVSGV